MLMLRHGLIHLFNCTICWTVEDVLLDHNNKERLMVMYTIRNVRGHVQVYYNGKFLFSADSEREAREELREYAQSAA